MLMLIFKPKPKAQRHDDSDSAASMYVANMASMWRRHRMPLPIAFHYAIAHAKETADG